MKPIFDETAENTNVEIPPKNQEKPKERKPLIQIREKTFWAGALLMTIGITFLADHCDYGSGIGIGTAFLGFVFIWASFIPDSMIKIG